MRPPERKPIFRKEMHMKTSTFALSTTALACVLSLGCMSVASAQSPSSPTDNSAMKSDQPVKDTWITTKVKSELATTDGVKSMDIGVKTIDGVVTLTGVLKSDIAVKKAVAAAQSVKGVKSVDSSGLKSKG
jgi:hyperosmotically inducible periplasmic protein